MLWVRPPGRSCSPLVKNFNRLRAKMRLRDLHADRRESPAFLFGALCFGVTRGEQPLVRASRASKVAGTFLVLFWCAKENLAPMQKQSYPAHRRAMPLKRKRATVPHGTLALSPHLCAAAVGMRTVYSMYPSRSSRWAVAGTPLSVIRRMAWSMVFTKMRTSFTIEMR